MALSDVRFTFDMDIGIMNNPFWDMYEDLRWIGSNDFDFIDLTLEPTRAQPQQLDIGEIKKLLKKYNLYPIGHTCFYLPYAHLIKEVREASIVVFEQYIDFMANFNTDRINIHTDKRYPEEAKDQVVQNHIDVLNRLSQKSQEQGMELMFENTHSGLLYEAEDILYILENVPDLKLHLDIGHAHVAGGMSDVVLLIEKTHDRIAHLHYSDNNGTFDQHLTLGAGKVDWSKVVNLTKKYLPETSIALEVFARTKKTQREFQLMSRDKLKQLWEAA